MSRREARRAPGPTLGFLAGINLRREGPEALQRLARGYGQVVRLRLGPRIIHLVNTAEGVQHVLQENARNYRKSAGSRLVREFLGEGLLTAEGEVWRRHRRHIQPAFGPARASFFVTTIAAVVQRFIARWTELARRGEPVDVHAEMMKLTLDVVARSLFSADGEQHIDALQRAFGVSFEHTVRRLHSLVKVPTAVPTPANLRFRRAIRTLDAVVDAIIDARASQPPGDDLLSALTAPGPEGQPPLSRQELRDELLTLLLGGYDTSASAFAWSWFALSRHPEMAEGIRAEAAQVIGDGTPSASDLGRLAWSGQVFEESMRLYPPVWVLAREAIADDVIAGFHIPANSMVLLSPYVIQRDERHWPNPEVFDPARFAAEIRGGRPRYSFFPFGGGARQCMGMGLAMMEAKVVLPMLASRFVLTPVPGWQPRLSASITMSPRGGLPMFIRVRDPALGQLPTPRSDRAINP